MFDLFATPIMCMALNIYHEARNESTVGQMAVAQVVMNRVVDDRFPDNVCDVITQGVYVGGRIVKHKCAFSWYCDGLPDDPRNMKAFTRSQEVAAMVLEGWTGTFFDGATHYHADYVNPDWAKYKTRIVKIDTHIFYRWD